MTLASLFRMKWRLEVLDDPTQWVEGQFVPTEFEEGIGTKYATIAGFGSEDPVTQWTGGQLDTVSFTARFFAKSIAESVTEQIEAMIAFTRRDPQRRSPPPLLFTWGREISKVVVITSLGGIRYDNIRIDGTIRGCTMQVQLTEYRQYQAAFEELTGGESFIHVAKDEDTFESIAAFHFNRPDWGDLIRSRNPQYVDLQPGNPIEVPEEWVLRTETVEPRSIPFARGDAETAYRQVMFEARQDPYVSHVI